MADYFETNHADILKNIPGGGIAGGIGWKLDPETGELTRGFGPLTNTETGQQSPLATHMGASPDWDGLATQMSAGGDWRFGSPDWSQLAAAMGKRFTPGPGTSSDKANAYRAEAAALGIKVDQGDAELDADPRYQAWQPGQPLPASLTDVLTRGSESLGNVGNGLPQAIRPFNQTFQAPDPQKMFEDPSIKAQLEAGEELVMNNAAARGVAKTGGTLRRLQEVGQNVASQGYRDLYDRASREFDRAYGIFRGNEADRFQSETSNWRNAFDSNAFKWGQTTDQFNMNRSLDRDRSSDLISLAQIGHPGSLGGLNAQYANQFGNLITNQGNANAAAQATSGAANANALSGIGDSITSLALMKALQQRAA